MISVLIVDDESDKVQQIRSIIEGTAKDASIEVATTAAQASDRLTTHTFDLLVVDLSIPLREEQSPVPNGGITLLRNLKRMRSLKLPRHILGLTQHDELQSEYADEFARDLWHIMKFDRSTTDWIDKLTSKIIHLTDSPVAQNEYDVDLAIVTALHEVELESVLKLDAGWKQTRRAHDTTSYYEGLLKNESASIRVVAAASVEMGMSAAAALSMKLIHQFKPRLLAMCGIAAGVKGALGDILIADRCWDYGSGKYKSSTRGRRSRFLPEPTQIQIPNRVKDAVANFILDRSVTRKIQDAWLGPKPTASITAKIGPFASGAAVVQNRSVISALVRKNRKLLGVEMETYGVYMAAKTASTPMPEFISVKSICDFGGRSKDDKHQLFAAYTSAAFLRDFALHYVGG